MVYVINENGKALMPCSNAIARILLKEQKAKVKQTTPFTIKLLYTPKTTYTQKLTLGIDTGSSVIGSAVVSKKKVLYRSEIIIRNDITSKMNRRRKYRRTRRSRKCRYHPCRFLNRRNSIKKGRLSPTIRSKIDAHIREIQFVQSLLPITDIILESGSFDPHLLNNLDVRTNPTLYQKGALYGFYNMKAFVLERDQHTCQHCKGKLKDPFLHCHHIIFKINGGRDTHENLITLCKTCHKQLHEGLIILRKRGKKKSIHATQMNVIISQILQKVPCQETYGYITKYHRELLNLPKTHCNDAIVIASRGHKVNMNYVPILLKKCVAKGDYQQTKGVRSQQRIPTGKICGFRKFDKVKYNRNIFFIKGRMSKGYAILMNIYGTRQSLKPIPKFRKMQRIGSRKQWLMIEA